MEREPPKVPPAFTRNQDGKPDLRIWLSQTLVDIVPRFVLDHTGHLLAANQSFADLFALPGPFLLPYSELVPHRWPPFCLDGQRFTQFFQREAESQGCLVTTHRCLEHSPCFALSWRPWQSSNGKTVYQGWASSVNYPTPSHPPLHFQNAHRLILSILSCIPDPVFIKNETGVYSLVNPAFAEYIGLPVSAVLGKTDFELLSPEVARQCLATDQKVIHTHQSQEYEHTIKDTKGQLHHIRVRKSPLFTSKGDFIGILGTCLDITDQKRQSLQGEQVETLLLQKDRQLEQISHDLKSTLSAMIEVLANLLNSVERKIATHHPPSIDELEMLSVTLDTTKYLFRLASELQQSCHHSGEKNNFTDNNIINLSALVKQVVNLNTPYAKKKQIRLSANYPDPCHLRADADRIREVLDNLINNAIKFSRPRSEVSVDVTVTESKIHLQVTDHGPGLTKEDQERLFQRFTTLSAKPTGGESSTGLGLSIAKMLVEQHSGRIWAENHPGKGAAFHVEWPAP